MIGVMPELALPRGNFLVTPVLAWWAAQSPVRVVDYGESAQVFRVPVETVAQPGPTTLTVEALRSTTHPEAVWRFLLDDPAQAPA